MYVPTLVFFTPHYWAWWQQNQWSKYMKSYSITKLVQIDIAFKYLKAQMFQVQVSRLQEQVLRYEAQVLRAQVHMAIARTRDIYFFNKAMVWVKKANTATTPSGTADWDVRQYYKRWLYKLVNESSCRGRCMFVYVYACRCMWYVWVCMYMYVHVCIHVYVCICMYIYAYVYICMCMYVYVSWKYSISRLPVRG